MHTHIIYYATYKDIIVYIGSGVPDRYKHVLSGASHVKDLNRLKYTEPDNLKVFLLKGFSTQEESLEEELKLIQEFKPLYNTSGLTGSERYSINRADIIQYSGDIQIATKKYVIQYSTIDKIKLGKATRFRDVCELYIKAISNKDSEQIDFIENYDEIFKLARLAFKSNLESNLKSISFQRSKLESRLDLQIKCNSENIKLALFETFKAKDIVTKSKIREIIDSLYTQEGIDKKARATDIKDYFVVVETTDKNKDGAFRIIRRK